MYLETTVVSYLASRPSRDLVVAAHQEITREWWEARRSDFELFVSEILVEEVSAGDPEAARKRLDLVATVPRLALTADVEKLARRLITEGAIPGKAAVDALHIAVATVHAMDYLVTWNCRHIANAEIRAEVTRVCNFAGYDAPIICTPEELMGD